MGSFVATVVQFRAILLNLSHNRIPSIMPKSDKSERPRVALVGGRALSEAAAIPIAFLGSCFTAQCLVLIAVLLYVGTVHTIFRRVPPNISRTDFATQRFPGMDAAPADPRTGKKTPSTASAKAPAAKRTPNPKNKREPSDGGTRIVTCKRYSQKYLKDIPVCHLQQWLEAADSVHANSSVTKTLDKNDLLTLLSFMLGWNKNSEPIASGT